MQRLRRTSPPSLSPGLLKGRSNLTDEVAETLTAEILTGVLGPGEQLPTGQEYCDRFGVSRTVVREAISRLKADGLIDTHQGRGAFVAQAALARPFRLDARSLSSPSDTLRLLELRISVETEAAALAAERRTATDLKRLSRILHRLRAAVRNGEDGVAQDQEFHRAIADATKNSFFSMFLEFLSTHYGAAIREARANSRKRKGWSESVETEHQAIFDAIEAGDTEMARNAIRTHLLNGRIRMMRPPAGV